MALRLFAGSWSFLRKLIQIDSRFVVYTLVGGPKPPRIMVFSFGLALATAVASVVDSLIKSAAGASFLAVLVAIFILVFVWAFANAPPARWHILSDFIRLEFHPAQDKVVFTDSLELRSMRKSCDSIGYPITQIKGAFSVTDVSQDGVPLQSKLEGQGGPGYVVVQLGREYARITITLRRSVEFGQKTTVVVRWQAEGGGASTVDEHSFDAQTLVDHLTIAACFHRDKLPQRIAAFCTIGVREEEMEFISPHRAEGRDHVCETWSPARVDYSYTYALRWTW